MTRPMWTEDELDAALAELHAVATAASPGALMRQRTRLYAEIEQLEIGQLEIGQLQAVSPPPAGRPRLRRLRPLLVSAVAAAAAIAVISTTNIAGGDRGASAEADTVLDHAVAALGAASHDLTIPAGTYLRTTTHVTVTGFWNARFHKYFRVLAQHVVRTWEPADPTDTWVRVESPQRTVRWVVGSPTEGAKLGVGRTTPGERRTAPCGDFYAVDDGQVPCHDSRAGWQNPTLAWLATLPRDPDRLYGVIADAAPRTDPAEIFTYLVDTLQSGLVPADLRAAFYKVMRALPGLTVTENDATIDGRHGTALGIAGTDVRQDVIIDPDTGQYIGEREVTTRVGDDGTPAGTLLLASSVQTALVTSAG